MYSSYDCCYLPSFQDIFLFNINALNDGHELNDLPLIEDQEIDLATFRLGPVTPTIPFGSHMHPLLMTNMSQTGGGLYSAAFGDGKVFTAFLSSL